MTKTLALLSQQRQ